MAIRTLKPNTNGQRGARRSDRAQITTSTPEKSLLVKKGKIAGRSNGTIRIRHRGGANKRHYRMIDFKGSDKMGIPGTVKAIEYDPNRNAFIALIFFADGEKRYQIAHKAAKVGDIVVTDTNFCHCF